MTDEISRAINSHDKYLALLGIEDITQHNSWRNNLLNKISEEVVYSPDWSRYVRAIVWVHRHDSLVTIELHPSRACCGRYSQISMLLAT